MLGFIGHFSARFLRFVTGSIEILFFNGPFRPQRTQHRAISLVQITFICKYGYYSQLNIKFPINSKKFTNLTHYAEKIRSGFFLPEKTQLLHFFCISSIRQKKSQRCERSTLERFLRS